ncbi:hypothetical protein BT69DRAFT_1276946 [Atractiella rhizophila]|nr:hypothetical protein BT69DRAFT_1276946 [Atractiella rhizophila]
MALWEGLAYVWLGYGENGKDLNRMLHLETGKRHHPKTQFQQKAIDRPEIFCCLHIFQLVL